jgi:hypothetical protein
MSPSSEPKNPVLGENDGPALVSLVNWAAESLDIADLSLEQAMTVALLMETLANALWGHFPRVMVLFFAQMRARYREVQGIADDADDRDDSEDPDEDSDDSEHSGNGHH